MAKSLPSIIFKGSGPEHRPGLVPDPGALVGITRFLREDGVWSELGLIKHNYAASAPPTRFNDISQGYVSGSMWLMPTTGDSWRCRTAIKDNASWIREDVLDHGGYVTNAINNQWYLPVQTPQVAGGANPGTAGLITLIPGVIKARLTINALGLRVATAFAGGNAQAAVYSNIAGRPGALISSTASMPTGSVASVNNPLINGNLTLDPEMYWWATCMDNTSAALLCAIATSANTVYGALLGSTSQTVAMTAQGFGGYTTPGTFGSWPTDLTTATLTDVTSSRCGVVAFRVASVP